MQTLSESTVFFAHQWVGDNLMDAMPALYDRSGVAAPAIAESDVAESGAEGRITHVRVGKDGDPLGKAAEFDRIVRAGMGESVDVSVLILGYVDPRVVAGVSAVFAAYQSTTRDGTRVSGRHDGNFCDAMDKAYTSDPGHPNPDGARVAASAIAAVLLGAGR